MKLNDSIQYLKGIGEARAKLFSRLGIRTIRDLLYHLPRTYEDRSQIKNISDLMDGDFVCISGRLADEIKSYRTRSRLSVTQTSISDGTGIMRVVWFNAPYISATLKEGADFTFYGKAIYKGQFFEMVNPVVDANSSGKKTGKIIPFYPLSSGLAQNNIRSAIEQAFLSLDEMPADIIPDKVIKSNHLLPLSSALKNIHAPETLDVFENARERLAFEELFILQTGILLMRDERFKHDAVPIKNVKCVADFAQSLPFALTNAQKRVINEICSDLRQSVPMNRLVQGDVGSGKTIVAASAIFAAVNSGFQAALMAPTEILAMQHYKNFTNLFSKFGFKTVFLSGGMSAQDRRQALAAIKDGSANIVVGTHAIITDKVIFNNLALVITDEQHRFGVRQRSQLTEKGINAHTLVMTATPIPRTLSLILYGDLDISVIDELPPGRKKIETISADSSSRDRINEFIIKNINDGRQAYIVCPLIEESEALTAKSVTEYADSLKKGAFKNYSVGVLHGKLKPSERNDVMSRFANGEIDILVSTTVIEVGVDVPNATIMIIENSERFGLSQLHQLRGRIGRGKHQSYCILFCDGGKIAKERVKIMCQTNDGFKISEKDLLLRGPGEFFGVRQHGLPELKIANLSTDMHILKRAKDSAQQLIQEDPSLNKIENHPLKNAIFARFSEVGDKKMLN